MRMPDTIMTDVVMYGTIVVTAADGSSQREIGPGRCPAWVQVAPAPGQPATPPSGSADPHGGLTLDRPPALVTRSAPATAGHRSVRAPRRGGRRGRRSP
jgi:hypothetical protein